MLPLVTKPLVMMDVLYSLDWVTIRQIMRFWKVLEKTKLKPKLNLYVKKLWKGLRRVTCYEWYFEIVIRNLKYHEWYFCQISRTNHAIICLYYHPQKVCNFLMYFKLSWITTALSQSNCRNFSCSSIIDVTVKKDSLLVYVINFSEFWQVGVVV